MGIARRGLDVAVAEQFADHRERLAERQGAGREAVSEIVQQNVLKRALAPAVC